jgi:tetratricopeptide (TPR) repeat protein
MTPEFWTCEQYDRESQRLYEDGDYTAALELLKEGLALYPASPELAVSIGYTRLAREEFAWARRSFQAALQLEPDHEEALAGMGEVHLKLGERGRAFLLFERVLDLGFGSDPDLMLCIGRILFREALYERAERFLRLATIADRKSTDAALELACTLYRRGDLDGSLRWARRSMMLDPIHHEARVFTAGLLYERGDFPEALEVLEAVPVENLWDPVAAWRMVELLRRVRGLDAEATAIRPYMERLDLLTAEPTAEERILAEIEMRGAEIGQRSDLGQLDLFGWIPPPAGDGDHRVRVPDGRVFEGDWATIVRAMRDGSANPTVTLDEFMREEARRLHDLTGVMISWENARSFITESARLGALRIER